MYFILCIETATEVCSVAVVSPTKVLALVEDHEGNKHASQLTILIEEAVKQAGITLPQLDAIAVSKGPGSYTGLRVGVSTAKGLCYALDKPLIAIPTLQALVNCLWRINHGTTSSVGDKNTLNPKGLPLNFAQNSLFIPMLDARRMEVYCAGYDIEGNEILATEAKIIDETSFVKELNNGPVYFMGNGANKCKSVISHSNAFFIDDIHCSAAGMFKLAATGFENSRFQDVAYFEPFYLKDFVATTPKKRV